MMANTSVYLSLYAVYGIEDYMNAKYSDLDARFFSIPIIPILVHTLKGFVSSVMDRPTSLHQLCGSSFPGLYSQEASWLTQ